MWCTAGSVGAGWWCTPADGGNMCCLYHTTHSVTLPTVTHIHTEHRTPHYAGICMYAH